MPIRSSLCRLSLALPLSTTWSSRSNAMANPSQVCMSGCAPRFSALVYSPWLKSTMTLMEFVLGTALIAAFLLSNLALEPLEEISRQLDYWTAASEETEEEEKAPRQDMAARVSNKIDLIGQRMRNVEEVFSALKENLDQILGNLQDGILSVHRRWPRGPGV
jgi:hypothetical protein